MHRQVFLIVKGLSWLMRVPCNCNVADFVAISDFITHQTAKAATVILSQLVLALQLRRLPVGEVVGLREK